MRRDWPLGFYDPKTLFSSKARLGWVEPDLAKLPEVCGGRGRGRGRGGCIWVRTKITKAQRRGV